MKTVAFVPIRLNSKRVVGKNLKSIGDKPLLSYVLETLSEVEGIDDIYVYCSSDEIKEYLPEKIKYLKRPAVLDGDLTLGQEIYNAFVAEVDADIYVLAHTTSPFIKKERFENAVAMVKNEGYDSAFSAQKYQTFAWYQGQPLNYALKEVPRTQTIDPVFVETSAFYIFRKEVWVEYGQRIGFNPYIQEVDQIEGIDIDYPEDFAFAEKIVEIL